MGNIQPSHGPVTDNTHLTPGGNTTVRNGDELLIDDTDINAMECVYSDLGEDDSHVAAAYREHSEGMQM